MKKKEHYDIYSKFDIDKHAEVFLNYLEVVIDENGIVYYAVPSHIIFLETLLKRRIGDVAFRSESMCQEAFLDYSGWLCKQTKCIMVWNNFYIGRPNFRQLEVLKKLKEKKYKTLPDVSLYRGKFQQR